MRRRIVSTIARKELLEAFRDKRTLFLMVFLPILLYPALLIVVAQVAAVQIQELEETASVVALIEGSGDANATLADVARTIDDDPEIELVRTDNRATDPRAHAADAVLDVSGWSAASGDEVSHVVEVHFRSVDERSRQALDRVEAHLREWSDAEMAFRIEARGLDPTFLQPIDLEAVNHADTIEQGGFVLGSLLPILIIMTVLLGAYYPAIDLTAGEKERGSIQTLFTAPISAIEIVTGKYLAVVGISLVSGGANLFGMVLVASQQKLLLGDEIAEYFDFSLSLPVIAILIWTIFLIALFFSSLLIAVAVLARSFKEAQTFITPVYLLCLIPATIAQLPGFAYSTQLAVVPAVGVILLMKEVLLNGPAAEPVFLVTAATLIWSALLLLLGARFFGQEEVIVGERAGFGLLTKRSHNRPKARPSVGEGVAWYAIGMVLLFYVGATAQSFAPQPGLIVTLWGVVLGGTLALIWWLRLDIRATLALHAPRPRDLLGTLMLALGTIVMVNGINTWIETHVISTPPEMAEAMLQFFPQPESPVEWVWIIFLVAVSPAICEEAMFRGFLLSSVRGRVSDLTAAAITGLAFGLFHLSIYRLFGTTALGFVMAAVVLRTGSIWTGVLFHFVNNCLGVLALHSFDPKAPAPDIPTAYVLTAAAIGLAGAWVLWSGPPARSREVDD